MEVIIKIVYKLTQKPTKIIHFFRNYSSFFGKAPDLSGERAVDIGYEVLRVLKTAAQADEVRADACGAELGVGHLAVRGAGGVQAAGAGVRDVGLDGGDAQVRHEIFGGFTPALHAEADNAAGAVGKVLLPESVVLVTRQTAILDPCHALVSL